MAQPPPAAEAADKPPAPDQNPAEQQRREIEREVYERRSAPDKPAEEELERRRAEHPEPKYQPNEAVAAPTIATPDQPAGGGQASGKPG